MSGKTPSYLGKQDEGEMASPDSSEDIKVRLSSSGNYQTWFMYLSVRVLKE